MTVPPRAFRVIQNPLVAAVAAFATVAGAGGAPTGAAAGETTTHALSAWATPKLPADFTHLPYVNPNAPKGGAITIEASGSFDSFNPFILKGLAAQGIGQVYETLMTGSSDELTTDYGLLAESATLPDDGTWVLFTLREGAKFHDGEPVTAEDVAWTFNTLMEKGHPQYKAYWHDVAKVEVVDPRRAKFTFREGAVNKELPLIVGQLPVLPKHWWEGKDFAAGGLEVPMGSGPYRIASFEAGRSIVYERVADYWGETVPVNGGRTTSTASTSSISATGSGDGGLQGRDVRLPSRELGEAVGDAVHLPGGRRRPGHGGDPAGREPDTLPVVLHEFLPSGVPRPQGAGGAGLFVRFRVDQPDGHVRRLQAPAEHLPELRVHAHGRTGGPGA